MTEIKKLTKISLLAYGTVCFIYFILTTFLLDMLLPASTGLNNPFHPRMFGGALLVVTIYSFLIVIKKSWEWEKIKLTFEFMYSWILVNIIVEASLLALYGSLYPAIVP
ncbi:MAG: hypothetical protein ACFFG0_35395, partial [Candidatus Thorarchaeota archaeon]